MKEKGTTWQEESKVRVLNIAKMKAAVCLYLLIILVLTRDIASKACSDKCGSPAGTGVCQSDGTCLCWWGWTGPKSSYLSTNRIVADHCQWACHYTNTFRNPDCTEDDDGNCSGADSDDEDD